jgi:hypothetical protein
MMMLVMRKRGIIGIMRTTTTLDDDVTAKVSAEAKRTGGSFKDALNDLIRRGLTAKQAEKPRQRFVVHARDLCTRDGIALDNIGELLEQIEGVHRR